MTENLTATARTRIDASAINVWNALTDAAIVKQFMFGTELVTDWEVGGPILWRGEWEGRPYEDRGTVLDIVPAERLQVTHFSPLSGLPDIPENHHTLTYDLRPDGEGTVITLTQDNAHSVDEQQHDAENWSAMLESLKRVVEGSRGYDR
jgi:uncharacterized protein YndB with AHSA1/START domain